MSDNRRVYRTIRQGIRQMYPGDWSLFRLGLAFLDYLLKEELPIPVSFSLMETKSVR